MGSARTMSRQTTKGRFGGARSAPVRSGTGHVDSRAAAVLDLQRSAGNKATTMAVQRFDFGEAVGFGGSGFGGGGFGGGGFESDTEGPGEQGGLTQPVSGGQTQAGGGGGQGAGPAGGQLNNPLLAGSPRVVQAFLGNPLTVGMTNDGVAVLQQALDVVGHTPKNSKRQDGTFDGAWGGGTTAAVASFQSEQGIPFPTGAQAGPKTFAALDQALPGNGGGVNPPEIVPINPELEARLDQIMIAYTRMLNEQNIGIRDADRDLHQGQLESAQPSFLGGLLIKAGNEIIDNLLGGGPFSLRKPASQFVKDLPDVLQKGINDPFDKVQNAAKDGLKQEINPTQPTAKLDDFMNGQFGAVREAGLQSQINFSTVTKPQLREITNEDVLEFLNNPLVDPRLTKAQKLLDGMNAAVAEAKGKQTLDTLQKWALANAQQTLGASEHSHPGGPNTAGTFTEGLKGHTGKNEVPGILTVDIDFDSSQPKGAVSVKSLSMAGMTETVRNRLSNTPGATVGSLNYPRRAMGSTGIVNILNFGTNIDVAMSEDNAPNNVNCDGEGLDWVTKRGDGSFDAGVTSLFAALDATALSAVGGIKAP